MSDQPQSDSSLNVGPPVDGYRVPSLARTPPSKIAAVLAMDQLGVPREAIARQEGMGKSTVYQIIKQGDQMDPAIVERVKRHFAAHWWITGERALQGITPEKIEAANASQLGILAAVATDKALLLEGKPTARIEYQSAADQEMASQVEALQAELEGWKTGQTINVEGTLGGTEGQASTE